MGLITSVQARQVAFRCVHVPSPASPADPIIPSPFCTPPPWLPPHPLPLRCTPLPPPLQASSKPYKELTDLRLVQQVPAHQGVVWAMRFSRSGRYLASAGQDGVVRVWEVIQGRGSGNADAAAATTSAPTSQQASPRAGGAAGSDSGGGSASPGAGSAAGGAPGSYGVPVLCTAPYRTYRGHKSDVLDLAWSKTNFLLSASMDKTVRLWHVSMDECLRVFK